MIFDKYINGLIDKKLKDILLKIMSIELSIQQVSNSIGNNKEILNMAMINLKHDMDILIDKSIDRRMLDFYSQIRAVRDDLSSLESKIPMTKEELEIQLDGIIKIFETKLDVLGYKKIITTDLLKKIAKSEDKNVLT